jgi:hypothetical protein
MAGDGGMRRTGTALRDTYPPAIAWVLSTLTRTSDGTVPSGAVFAEGAARAGPMCGGTVRFRAP